MLVNLCLLYRAVYLNTFFFWSNNGWYPVYFVTAAGEWHTVVHQKTERQNFAQTFRQYYCKDQMFQAKLQTVPSVFKPGTHHPHVT